MAQNIQRPSIACGPSLTVRILASLMVRVLREWKRPHRAIDDGHAVGADLGWRVAGHDRRPGVQGDLTGPGLLSGQGHGGADFQQALGKAVKAADIINPQRRLAGQ